VRVGDRDGCLRFGFPILRFIVEGSRPVVAGLKSVPSVNLKFVARPIRHSGALNRRGICEHHQQCARLKRPPGREEKRKESDRTHSCSSRQRRGQRQTRSTGESCGGRVL